MVVPASVCSCLFGVHMPAIPKSVILIHGQFIPKVGCGCNKMLAGFKSQ